MQTSGNAQFTVLTHSSLIFIGVENIVVKINDGAFPVKIFRYLYFVGRCVIRRDLILCIGKHILQIFNLNEKIYKVNFILS